MRFTFSYPLLIMLLKETIYKGADKECVSQMKRSSVRNGQTLC